MQTLNINIPQIITKELALTNAGVRRKFRMCSNFLPLVGFEKDQRHDVKVIPGMGGLRLTTSSEGSQKVYSRRYNARRNNPLETVIEIGAQSILDAAIPSYTERVHVTMRNGEIIIKPLANRTFSIRRAMRDERDLFATVAMTSGIDVRCLMDSGFKIDSILEYRPHESRDTADKTETGALNCLANARPRLLLNEDISRVDWDMVRGLMADAPQIATMHLSLQCDDFSLVKASSLKQQSIDDLSTTRDLVYDGLRMIETIRPATVILENVPGFATSAEGMLMKIKLRKWGYEVTDAVLQGGEFGGMTRRERYYLMASVFPGFEMPTPSTMRTAPIWPEIEPFLDTCRDVTHTKSLQDGLTTGRARLITRQSAISPTILKSQSRQAKDSVYIDMGDGSYRLPSLELQRHLQGIPADLCLNSANGEVASEIVGQSIEYPMHEVLVRQVHQHIADNIGRHTALAITRMVRNSVC